MTSFLEEQVRRIFDQHQGEIDEISIIIPNRRAAVYIQKYIAALHKKPFFSPEILTIHDWVDQHTKEDILKSTELLFLLYGVHCEIEGAQAEAFEQFILWGQTILSDFDEIDKYMVDPKTVFQNLRDIKVLESWAIEEDEMSPAQQQFQRIWDKLSNYYDRLNTHMKTLGATYSGKAYFNFFQKMDLIDFKKKVYFLGFNAISKVERSIMKYLVDKEIGEAIFDVDAFYFENEAHEAGHFYRQLCRDWKIQPTVTNHFNSTPKTIEIIETSQQVGQAKIGGAIVKQLLESGNNLNHTAIVLADESLLIPLTKSLPQELEKANITMGWPIKFSHLKSFLDVLFDFQFNFQKFKSESLYHKTLINFLEHPYTTELLKNDELKEIVQRELRDRNSIFIERPTLFEILPALQELESLLTPWNDNNTDRIDCMDELMQLLYLAFKPSEKRAIDLEIIYQFQLGTAKFRHILSKYPVSISLSAFKKLFYQFWQNESLSFLGNPIDGLQIMGILETRALDFKQLIILGMNEGILPKGNQVNSFIPGDLKRYLQLPTEEDRQAVFAHHFYRLLHRTEHVYMTYNSSSDGWTSGERSRFIIQLENELDLSKHKLIDYVYASNDSASNTTDVVYRSTPSVQKRLDELFERGLSPSALNKLIVCPLDFYYRYILKFDESDEIEESIEASTFGTKIHRVLEEIIRENFEKEDGTFDPLSIEKIQAEKNERSIHQRLEQAYLNSEDSKKFRKSDLKYGQNKLSFDVSKRFIGAFLEEQLKELKSTTDAVIPLYLEKNIQAEFNVAINGEQKTIRLNGNADRIDKKGATYRIIDYKSGKSKSDELHVKLKELSDEALDDLMGKEAAKYTRQLLMYALMFRASVSKTAPFSAGIVSMVNISDWIQTLKFRDHELIDDDLLAAFEGSLKRLIEQLYEPNFEFRHNPEAKYCQHCNK